MGVPYVKPPSAGNKYDRADNQAMVITPPRKGQTVVRAITATVDVIKVPDSWLGKWVNLIAMGNDAYFQTGPDANFGALALTASAVDATSKVVTVSSNTPFPMPQGSSVPYYFDPKDDAYMAVFNTIAGGNWFGAPSSPTAGGT